jgi:hypothetical protein
VSGVGPGVHRRSRLYALRFDFRKSHRNHSACLTADESHSYVGDRRFIISGVDGEIWLEEPSENESFG